MLNQKGVTHYLLLIAVMIVLIFIAITSLTSFNDKIFSSIFPKDQSFASGPLTATFGNMNLSATFNSIGIELFYSGNVDASTIVEYKRSSDTTFKQALPLGPTIDGSVSPGPAFYGSVLLLESGTSYDIKVTLNDPGQSPSQQTLTGSITTRPDNIPTASSLTPTHFVRSDGNDSNPGTGNTTGAAWATLCKAVRTAPADAVVQVAPGYYASPNSAVNTISGCNKDQIRANSITFVAEKPAVDDNQNIINPGQHSVIDYGVITSPVGSNSANPGVWQQVTLTGPATGQPYTVYKWSSPYATSAIAMGYAPSRDATPQRVASWDLKSGTATDKSGKVWYLKNASNPADASGWAEVLYNNKMYNYGFASFGSDIYVRIPGDLDPNNYFLTVTLASTGGITDGLAINAANSRFSGFEVRQVGIDFRSGSSFGVIDHNLFVSRGVYLVGTKPGTYGSDHLIENNRFVDSTLHSPNGTDPYITWTFIKSAIQLPDGTSTPWSRVGSGSGGGLGAEMNSVTLAGGAKRSVIRNNTIIGTFNGIGSNNTGYDRYSAQDIDSYNNLIQQVNDDAFEPEQQVINWRIWNNRIENTAVGLSTGPVSYGPIYYFRNTLWRIGGHGNVPDQNANSGTSGQGFKYSGSGITTKARIYVINNTFWTNSPSSVSGGSQAAGGGSNQENFYLRNNLFRMTRYGFDAPGTPGKWDEDYNFFATTDLTRGMNYDSANKATVAIYRSSTSQGTHTNLPATDPTQDFHSLPDAWLTNPTAGDLTLQAGTPIIDAGVVVPNIAESFNGSALDLGSVEQGGASSTASPSPVLKPGDIDNNGKVDIFDYNLLLTDFGKNGALAADIDKNGKVDIFDYNLLLTNFMK